MEADPWEALDLDDSDLPSLLRPCKRKFQDCPPPSPKRDLQTYSLLSQPVTPFPKPNSPPPSSPTLIPGPAGAVQAAMRRKLHNRNNPFRNDEEPLSTQEYIRRAVENPGADDDDFSRDPWLFALEFIHREGLADNGGTIGTPLSWIKTEPKLGNRKVAQVVAIIKSCTPNGLGDLMVTLKDPTGTLDASIHHKVLAEGGFGKDVSVGTVLILQKVSIFSPSPSARYLNITLSNVVKAISKDNESLPEQSPASKVASTVHIVENRKKPWHPQRVSTLSLERHEELMNGLRQTGYMRGRVHNDKGIEGDEALGSSCYNGRNRSQNAFAGREPSVRQKDTVSGTKEAAVVADTNEHEENFVLEKQSSPCNLAGRDHLESNQSSGGANLFGVVVNRDEENATMNGGKEQRQLSISRGSLPQWTDEQLDELCSFDWDDDGSY